jgi:hypothetical protein
LQKGSNTEGLPVAMVIAPGPDHDVTAYPALMEEADDDPEPLLGDKGYASDSVRTVVEQRGGEAMIATKANHKVQNLIAKAAYGQRDPRPVNRSALCGTSSIGRGITAT